MRVCTDSMLFRHSVVTGLQKLLEVAPGHAIALRG